MTPQEVNNFCGPRFLGFLGDLSSIKWLGQLIYLTETNAVNIGTIVNTTSIPSFTKIEFNLLRVNRLSILYEKKRVVFEPETTSFNGHSNYWDLIFRCLERHPAARNALMRRSIYFFDNFCIDNTEEHCLWTPYKLLPCWETLSSLDDIPKPTRGT